MSRRGRLNRDLKAVTRGRKEMRELVLWKPREREFQRGLKMDNNVKC